MGEDGLENERGDNGAVKSYRGVTLMDTAYKIYACILDERLNVEIEDKLGESQFGFRKERGVIDAVYVLNHIIDKQLSGARGKLYACFADLKATFDRVSRKKLGEIMRRMWVNEKLTRRIEEIYEETRNVVRTRNHNTKEFWTVRGVRQGCPLSLTLFNIYVGGLEEEVRKAQMGGIVVGDNKDVELELSTEKTKVVVFEKRRNMRRKKRTAIAMKKTWSVGERIFKRDYKRRMRMFGALVESVALFGAEVWGWNIEERLDRVKRRYLRWILGVTSGDILHRPGHTPQAGWQPDVRTPSLRTFNSLKSRS
ncbi:uncharacterized protein LOC126874746 [Bombus huntii]|uniref:uncharacterized protein LOC126874746 n=1 Tax=Bombus huntii TaxID=85661 RepID=UPI0021A9BF44|nr:uncharacterized protein LOC126874746 [Bombus huntii]